MRHILSFDDGSGTYKCTICGAAFTQEALIAEMDAGECAGPKADEGPRLDDILGAIGSSGMRLTSIDIYTSDLSYTYSWRNPEPTQETRPNPYEDPEAKGRRLLKSAGYD